MAEMTNKLYNAQNKRQEIINDPSKLHEAILSGSHVFSPGTQIQGTLDGEEGSVPAENIQQAIQEGFVVKTNLQQVADDYAKENDSLSGAAKTAAFSFANQAALGIPEIIFNKTANEYDVAKYEALKKQNEAANVIGGVGGFGASLFLGSPLWKGATTAGKAVEKSVAAALAAQGAGKGASGLAKGLISKAAGMGTEGAVTVAPQAVTEAMLGDPDKAAETLMWGVGLGSLFGVGGHLASKATKAVKDSKVVSNLKTQLDTKFRESFDPNKLAVEAMNPSLSQVEKFSGIEEAANEAGEVVGTVITKEIDKLGETLNKFKIMENFSLFDQQDEYLKRITEKADELSAAVGSKFKAIEDRFQESTLINRYDVAENILKTIKKNPKIQETSKASLPAFEKQFFANFLEGKPEYMTLQEANQIKGFWQDQLVSVYERKASDDVLKFKDILAEIPREINKSIRGKIGSLDKDALADLVTTQVDLGNLKAAQKIAMKSAAREMKNNDLGITSFIMGSGALAGGLASGDLSGAAFGAMGIAGAREFIRRHGNQLASIALKSKGQGPLLAEQAMKSTGHKLDGIKNTLESLKKAVPKVKPRQAATTAIIRLLGDKDQPETKGIPELTKPMGERGKEYERLNKHVGVLASNPEIMTNKILEQGQFFLDHEAPMIGTALMAKMSTGVNYLQTVMPKPPRPNSPYASNKEWQPSFTEASRFERKMEVVLDPFVVLDELESGTLTREHVDALEAVYPRIYQDIKDRIFKEVIENPTQLPFKARVQLSILFKDDRLDPLTTRESINSLQGAIMRAGQEEEQGSKVDQFDVTGGMDTETQRIANK